MTLSPQERIRWEFAQLKLGDKRRNRRALDLFEAFLAKPDGNFVRTLETPAKIQGLYRLLDNPNIDLNGLLEPHTRETHRLMAAEPEVLVIHDSSECYFPNSPPENDIGYLGNRCGMLLHLALAVTSDEFHAPLGVAGVIPISRRTPQKSTKKARQKYRTDHPNCGKESNRWGALVARVERGASANIIHVMDREGDIYALMASFLATKRRFVIRQRHDRKVADSSQSISEVLENRPYLGKREVPLSKRDNTQRRRNESAFPTRDARFASLQARAARLRLTRPQHAPKTLPETVEVTVVQVIEPHAPAGEQPIGWTLLTSESVSNSTEAWKVVDHYRARWRIEEYFKALKTGCAFEKRPMESLDAVLHMFGIMAPIAWQMLATRTLLRTNPRAPAKQALRSTQLEVLFHFKGISPEAQLADALLAIAEMGGHQQRRKAPPGWLTLAKGFEKLDLYEAGWIAGRQKM